MSFHLYQLTEIFSNAHGTVQFIELYTTQNGQNFAQGEQISVTDGTTTRTYVFPNDLPGSTAGTSILLATQGYANLGQVTPDFIIPDGFLFQNGGTITFGANYDSWVYDDLQTNGTNSLAPDGNYSAATPTNYAGASSAVTGVNSGVYYFLTSGPDLQYGAINYDLLSGLGGDDTLGGSSGNDSVSGGDGNDLLYGNDQDDTLLGGAGNDLLDGGLDNDVMTGGAGNDDYVVDSVDDDVNESASGGTDSVQTLLDGYVLPDNVEILQLLGTDELSASGNDGNNVLNANDYGNELDGGDGNDTVFGGDGADFLNGGDGNDFIDGDFGDDTMQGSLGNDTYLAGSGGDQIWEYIGEGTDLVRTALDGYTLGSHVDNLTLIGFSSIAGGGNELANYITGNEAANQLDGFDGNDTFDGGAGADILTGGDGNDTYILGAGDEVYESTGFGTDTARASFTYTLPLYVDNLVLTGAAAANGSGNSVNNSITGNNAANVLDGKDGADALNGAGGNDNLIGGAGNDALNGGVGNDTMNGGAGNDNLIGGDGNDQFIGGTGNDTASGGAGNDTMTWEATDVHNGGAGTDTLKLLVSLNLVNTAASKLVSFERVDMTGGGINTLTVNQSEVLNLSEATNTLIVLGNAGDRVNLMGAFALQSTAGGFETWKLGAAIVRIETELIVI